MNNVLHLTHTDPNSDNRILKELIGLGKLEDCRITCIGVALNEGAAVSKGLIEANIISIEPFTKLLKSLPRPIKHSLLFVELFIRFIYIGCRVRPDIVHCHDTVVLPIGIFFKLFFKSIVIYDAHELESDKNGQSKFLSVSTLMVEKLFWSRIGHLISVSDSIIEWYNENLGTIPSTLVLNSPLLVNNNFISNTYFHDKYCIPKDELIFVYLGILGNGRGINLMIDAFLSDEIKSHLVFVGYGELSDSISKISLISNKIHLHSAVPHEEVVNLVKSADVGMCMIENISLSDYFCLPNKLFEYAFAGLSILSSDFPEIVRTVENYGLGKTCSVDSDSIKRAIIELEVSPPKNVQKDLQEISWQYQERKLIETYKNILSY